MQENPRFQVGNTGNALLSRGRVQCKGHCVPPDTQPCTGVAFFRAPLEAGGRQTPDKLGSVGETNDSRPELFLDYRQRIPQFAFVLQLAQSWRIASGSLLNFRPAGSVGKHQDVTPPIKTEFVEVHP